MLHARIYTLLALPQFVDRGFRILLSGMCRKVLSDGFLPALKIPRQGWSFEVNALDGIQVVTLKRRQRSFFVDRPSGWLEVAI
jgi:hypothetical protein